jgi:hypothetical protein
MNANPNDELLDELRTVLRRTDPVPAEVTDFAKAALGWRRLDAELAELLEDSALESDSAALTRGAAGLRSLTFRSDELTIDVEVQPETLLGQLAPPPVAATIELQLENGNVAATVESDSLGRFRLALEGEGEGRFRLRILRDGSQPLETSWFSL